MTAQQQQILSALRAAAAGEMIDLQALVERAEPGDLHAALVELEQQARAAARASGDAARPDLPCAGGMGGPTLAALAAIRREVERLATA